MSTPMKKYSTPAYVDNESGVTEFGSVDVYLASEVDARMAKATEPYEDRIAELEKALREIAALDYKNAATNGAAYEAVQIASRVLMERSYRSVRHANNIALAEVHDDSK